MKNKMRQIKPVSSNYDKQRTYAENMKKYNKAIQYGFYFEALIIDYAMIEDRLRSFIYHIGGLKTRNDYKISKGAVRNDLKTIVQGYKNNDENDSLGITNISGKMKIVRATLRWASEIEQVPDNQYLKALKSQYEGQLDIGGLLDTLDEIANWCKYRNEVIHALMNKSMVSVNEQLEENAIKGMELARYLDSQVRSLKRGGRIRKSIG
ncbi:MAG: hypothetical protein Q4A65_04210 [Bacillota bacterium]|nr:hypothetical protein [Bacillota bacterium]